MKMFRACIDDTTEDTHARFIFNTYNEAKAFCDGVEWACDWMTTSIEEITLPLN